MKLPKIINCLSAVQVKTTVYATFEICAVTPTKNEANSTSLFHSVEIHSNFIMIFKKESEVALRM